jgi:hypothetical protein
MKTTLQFNDDEIELATMAFNGAEAYYALSAIDETIRQRVKHQDISEEEHKFLDTIRQMTQIQIS